MTTPRADKTDALPGHASVWGLFAPAHLAASLMLAGGISLYAVETYVTATVMPSVVRDIGGLALFAWATTLYVAASVLGSIFIAVRPRGMSLNRTYMVGAAVFLVGSLVCALAPRMEIMLAGRALQGFGAGTLATLGYAFIRYVYPEPLWSKASTLYAAIWGVATFLGPTIGGAFASGSAWRYAFAIIIPFALIMGAMAPKLLPQGKDDRIETQAPVRQILLLLAAVLMVSLAGSVDAVALRGGLVVAAVVAIAAMIVIERRAPVRLLPRGGVSPRMPISRVYIALFMLLATLTSDIYIPYFLQVLHGVTPLVSGYLVALIALGWTLGAFFSGTLKGQATRYAIIVGATLEAVATGALVFLLARDNPQADLVILVPSILAMLGMGFGVGLGWAHLVTHVLTLASDDEKDKASAGITTMQSLGSAFGAAMAGVVVNSTGLLHPGGVAGNISAAAWLFGLFTLPALVALVATASLKADNRAGTNPAP